MTTNLGTYDISSLLAARSTTAKQIGVEAVTAALRADLAAHNAIVREIVEDLCEVSVDALRVWGGGNVADMFEVDEYGTAPGQKHLPGYNVGFPLSLFQFTVNFTRKFLESAPVSEIAQAQIDAEIAHKRMIEKKIRLAIFNDGNYNFRDINVDNVSLPVKRLLNADGEEIPNGEAGQTFTAATHTHYLSTGTAALADFTGLLDHVVEHGHGNGMKLFINKSNQSAYETLWSTSFHALQPSYIINANYAATAGIPNTPLDVTKSDNRMIGYLEAAEVWVKSWMPANYAFAFASKDPRKPLVLRQRKAETLQGLRLAAEFDQYPLLAKYYEAELGIGVWERSNGAVLYTGNDTWADVTS